MPEYSGTTITPADAVQTPAMNGATPGNFTLAALKSYVLASKGLANGLAGLDANGKLDPDQIPSSVKNVLVYATRSNFPTPGEAGKIYIARDDATMYFWDETLTTPAYVELSVDLSDYATKAEVAAADSNLNNAIAQHEARIENLEQKAGDYSIVQYRGTNAVPSGKAKNALVESIVGKSRGWMNMVSDGASERTHSGTYAAWVDTYTVDGTAPISGHKYLVSFKAKVTNHTAVVKARVTSGTDDESQDFSLSSTSYQTYSWIYTGNGSYNFNMRLVQLNSSTTDSGDTVYFKELQIRDLSIVFPELTSTQITTLGVAGLVAICPDILKYDSYGYSLVDTEVEGVESKGFNLCDEIFKQGRYSPENGAYISGTNRLCSENYIPVMPSTTYYFYMGYADSSKMFSNVCWYDDNNNFISAEMNFANTTKTSPPNASKALLSITPEYGTTYKHDICINISSSLNGTYTPYHAPDTLSLSTPVTLRSAGSVSDTDELNVEVNGVAKRRQTQRVSVPALLTSLTWSKATKEHGYYSDVLSNVKIPANTITIANALIIGGYVLVDESTYGSDDGKIFCISSTGRLNINDPSASDLTDFTTNKIAGLYFLYELATYSETLSDPIIDNFIEVEGGGTIETIQTQTPVIDNSLDVGYLAV